MQPRRLHTASRLGRGPPFLYTQDSMSARSAPTSRPLHTSATLPSPALPAPNLIPAASRRSPVRACRAAAAHRTDTLHVPITSPSLLCVCVPPPHLSQRNPHRLRLAQRRSAHVLAARHARGAARLAGMCAPSTSFSAHAAPFTAVYCGTLAPPPLRRHILLNLGSTLQRAHPPPARLPGASASQARRFAACIEL